MYGVVPTTPRVEWCELLPMEPKPPREPPPPMPPLPPPMISALEAPAITREVPKSATLASRSGVVVQQE